MSRGLASAKLTFINVVEMRVSLLKRRYQGAIGDLRRGEHMQGAYLSRYVGVVLMGSIMR